MRWLRFFILVFSYGLSACSITPNEVPFDDSLVFDTVSESDINAIEAAEDDYAKADRNQLALFAPKHMQEAQTHLQEAQQLEASASDRDIRLEHLKSVHALLSKARNIRHRSEQTLAAVFEKQQRLKTLGTPYVLKARYQQQQDQLRSLLATLERTPSAEVNSENDALLSELTLLERDTLLKLSVKPLETTLQSAIDEGAIELAPQSLAQSRHAIAQAKEQVMQYQGDDQSYRRAHQLIQKTQILVLKTLAITRDNAQLAPLSARAREKKLLQWYERLALIAQELPELSLEGLALGDQLSAIKQAMTERKKQTQEN